MPCCPAGLTRNRAAARCMHRSTWSSLSCLAVAAATLRILKTKALATADESSRRPPAQKAVRYVLG